MFFFSSKQTPSKEIMEMYDEAKEGLLEPGKQPIESLAPKQTRKLKLGFWSSLIVNVLLVAALFLKVSWLPARYNFCGSSAQGSDVETTSSSQQVVADFTYHPGSFDTVVKTINGTLFPPANPSWSRLAPGPKTNKIWEWFDYRRYISLSKSDVLKLGKDPSTLIRIPEGWGDGPADSYLGMVDVFHKIHCLNALRLAAFEGYPQSMTRSAQHHDAMHWIHLRHCVDQLAQDLQCNAKPDIISMNWMDTQENPFADFNIARTCTNWDQFMDWTHKNTFNPKDLPYIKRPQGTIPIPAEDAYYEMFGFGGSVLYPAGQGYKKQA